MSATLNDKQNTASKLLGAYAPPKAGKWITDIRDAAKSNLSRMGMPNRRDEYWKYSNPDVFNTENPVDFIPYKTQDKQIFQDIDRLTITFVDGIFDPAQSDELDCESLRIENLAVVAHYDIHWAMDIYGSLEKMGQSPVERPFATLNTACANQGMLIHVTDKQTRPIHLRYIHTKDNADAMVHHVIKVDEGALVDILETGTAGARFNSVLEVDIADGGCFNHIRTQGRAHYRHCAAHIFARLGKESIFKSFTLSMNGLLTRNEAYIKFTGDNAHATIAGAVIGDGNDFHNDTTVFVDHDALNCESRQVFKKVLRNGATGVFQGKILVHPDAQKTDGYQISQGLLLDDDSIFLAKPELEIYADDVACSHGSTVGAIDQESVFYLTSRGISKRQAQDMLVLAFLNETVDEITDDTLAEEIRMRLMAWMQRRYG